MSDNNSSIMYTDVVGYSKLTGDNQEIALIILEEHNQILNQYTNHYSGKIVKLTGDGLCALFDDPVIAIKCAIDIQKALDKRNKLNVKERQIQIRIGLHYGSYVEKDNDVFGDGVNLAKQIEPIAPHGGIAISETMNNMIWDQPNIYIRKHMLLDFNDSPIQTYEIYLDLIDWFKNIKKKKNQNFDADILYKKAHELFHQGDYSAAIKFSVLSLNDDFSYKNFDKLSFICHTFISLGEFKSGEKILNKLNEYILENSSNIEDENLAHFYKMQASLLFNSDLKASLKLFKKSLNKMITSNNDYVNEIIYNICVILMMDGFNEKEINDFRSMDFDNKNDYMFLLEGIFLAIDKKKKDVQVDDFIESISKMKNNHLMSFAYRIVAIIYLNLDKHDEAQNNISKAQDLLIKSSENISDIDQRSKFIENIFIHKDIMTFSDKISDYFLKMTISEISDDQIKNSNDKNEKFYNFCPRCGTQNQNNYKFCVQCGNNLIINV